MEFLVAIIGNARRGNAAGVTFTEYLEGNCARPAGVEGRPQSEGWQGWLTHRGQCGRGEAHLYGAAFRRSHPKWVFSNRLAKDSALSYLLDEEFWLVWRPCAIRRCLKEERREWYIRELGFDMRQRHFRRPLFQVSARTL